MGGRGVRARRLADRADHFAHVGLSRRAPPRTPGAPTTPRGVGGCKIHSGAGPPLTRPRVPIACRGRGVRARRLAARAKHFAHFGLSRRAPPFDPRGPDLWMTICPQSEWRASARRRSRTAALVQSLGCNPPTMQCGYWKATTKTRPDESRVDGYTPQGDITGLPPVGGR